MALCACGSAAAILIVMLLFYIRRTVVLVRGSYALLCNAIPEPVARKLRRGEQVQQQLQSVVPVFGDIVGRPHASFVDHVWYSTSSKYLSELNTVAFLC